MNRRIFLMAGWLAVLADGQRLVEHLNSGSARLLPGDAAALESETPRSDLPCVVTPVKPELGLDFVFHSGFQVTIPIKELSSNQRSNKMTILLRVTRQNSRTSPVYMSQKVGIQPRDGNETNVGAFGGAIVLGTGKYHVDWLMRDVEGHVCTSSWNVEASLSPKESQLKAWIAEGVDSTRR